MTHLLYGSTTVTPTQLVYNAQRPLTNEEEINAIKEELEARCGNQEGIAYREHMACYKFPGTF